MKKKVGQIIGAILFSIAIFIAIVSGSKSPVTSNTQTTAPALQDSSSSAGITPDASSSQQSASPANTAAENPVTPEKNPPGDIPDTQVFVEYISIANGYMLQVPEGWARQENANVTTFIDKFDGIRISMNDSALPLTADNINNNQISQLKQTGRAIQVKRIKETSFKGGPAVIVSYNSNSEPDSVTNKQIRLENESIYFLKNGKLAEITLWAPLGADNVDQWNLISNSFGWR